MIRLFILAVMLSVAQAALAQPGYMGKKFSVGFNTEMYGIANVVSNLSDGSLVALQQKISAAYTLHRKTEVVVAYHFTKNEVNNRMIEIGNTDYFQKGTAADKFKVAGFGLGFRFYGKACVAPIGMYHYLGYRFSTLTTTAGKYSRREYDNWFGYVYSTANSKAISTVLSTFTYGVGSKRSLGSGLWFNWEFDFNFTSKMLSTPRRESFGDLSKSIAARANRQYALGQFLTLQVGIGYMF